MNKETIKAVNVVIKGRVQGIGFRSFVCDAAESNGINGWVKNLPDSGVELEAEGYDSDLKRFLELVKNGHPGAYIKEFIVTEYPPLNNLSEFEIKY